MSRLRWFLFWRRQHHDLAREMDAHIAERVDALIDDGMTEADAHLQARREFGNVTLQNERSREVWIAAWLTSVWQDLRYAMRSLWRQPGFTVSAVGILAIGIGLVTTLFTVVNAVALRPWLVPDPSSLALLVPRPAPGQPPVAGLSIQEYRHLRDNSQAFSHLAAWMPSHVRGVGGARLSQDGSNTSIGVEPLFVTANYFGTLRINVQIGRSFLPEEENYTAPLAVAIISDRLWRHHFDSSESVLGRVILVDDHPFTVVGVGPRGFRGVGGGRLIDIWMPLPSVALGRFGVNGGWTRRFADPASGQSYVVGRLARGVTREGAQTEATVLSHQWRRSLALPLQSVSVRSTRQLTSVRDLDLASGPLAAVGLVFLSLGLVMLLACANVGNLILARGLSRTRETAIRLSLGAGRLRIARQFLTEALLMSTLAGELGLWIGWWVPVALQRAFPQLGIQVDEARLAPDFVVFGFVAGLAMLATLLSGLAPSLRLSRGNIAHRAGNRHMRDRSTGRLRTGLLAVQIGLSMVLLVSAGLMTRAAWRVLSSDPGFAIHEVQAINFQLGDAGEERRRVFARALADALRRASAPPHAFSEFRAITPAYRDADVRRMDGDIEISRRVVVRNVSPTYFETLGIPIVRGRAPALDSGPAEAVVNESMARALWRGSDPLGARVTVGRGETQHDVVVVGISADVPVVALGRLDPVLYEPLIAPGMLLIRSQASSTVQQVTGMARSIEPGVQVTARPLSDDLRDSASLPAFGSYFAWALGSLALTLATVGAFGVFAYMVEERRREIGVRMALGATSASVVRTVVGGARWPLVFGLGGGLVLSMLAAQLLRGTLYGLSPFDPITYIGIAAILTVAALIATWIPARRATRIDPAITLRGD